MEFSEHIRDRHTPQHPSPSAFYMRARAFHKLGYYDRAIADFQTALRFIPPGSPPYIATRNNLTLVRQEQAAQVVAQAAPGQQQRQNAQAPGQQQPAAPVLVPAVVITGEPTLWNVHDTASWIEAVGGIRGGGNNRAHIVRVSGNVSVPAVPAGENLFGTVTNIMVTLEGSGSFALSGTGSMLRIGNEQTVIVRDIVLRGHANNNSPLVEVRHDVITQGILDTVIVSRGGTFRMVGSASVTGNRGGVDRLGRVDNIAGGVSITGGNFIMQDTASVSGNTGGAGLAHDLGGRGGPGGVGGVSVNGGTFIMQDNATVSKNTGGRGGPGGGSGGTGGVHVGASFHQRERWLEGAFVMQGNASVSDNTGGGSTANVGVGGVVIFGAPFTMQDSTSVSGNVGNSGVRIGSTQWHSGTLTMRDSATVTRNTSLSGGGGVSGALTMHGNARVSGNTARGSGGGVSSGNLIMNDNASVTGNTARGHGGGVFGTLTMRGGTISSNTASQNGGGVNIYQRGRFTMHGGSIYGNTANQNGGGVFVSGGAGTTGDGAFTKTGGTVYGNNAERNRRNTANQGHAIFNFNGNWRNATAGPTINTGAFGFWLNEPN